MQKSIKLKTTTPLKKNPINPIHTRTQLQNKAKFPSKSRKSLNELITAPCATTWGTGWKRKGHEKTPLGHINTSNFGGHIWPSILHPPSTSHTRPDQPWAKRVALLLKSCWCLLQACPLPPHIQPCQPHPPATKRLKNQDK